MPTVAVSVTMADFLEGYYADYVEAEGLRDARTIKSRLKALKAVLGELPVAALRWCARRDSA